MSSQSHRPSQRGRGAKGTGVRQAYDYIRTRIASLELKPGSDLDEAGLVKQLGVSRTPVRQALVQLASEGLVMLLPNKTARVAPLGLQDVKEHLEAFDLIQRTAIRFAALRRSSVDLARIEARCADFEKAAVAEDPHGMIQMNWDFHQAIGLACGNGYIRRYYEQLLIDNLRIAHFAMGVEFYRTRGDYASHVETICREHRQIVDAIMHKDADTAEELGRSHTNLGRKRVIEYVSLSLAGAIEVDGKPLLDSALEDAIAPLRGRRDEAKSKATRSSAGA